MAQLLAPYNNGMRLGQGFNSYTQQVCLDHAVLEDTVQNRAKLARLAGEAHGQDTGKKAEHAGAQIASLVDHVASEEPRAGDDEDDDDDNERPPWTKPQIVTYSSRFVDKLSEVTDSMNISGALTIQTATVGGSVTGSYIDSDKFKESDINFHLQVKVVNQILSAPEYSLFNKIDSVEKGDFTAVYGDTFISGWEEGGELNAIISIKVADKSKIFEIKAALEANVSMGKVEGGVKGKFELTKDSISKSTETTIAVNWSGGGSIKDPKDLWTMDSLTRAAACFPDLVAITPQRTYAILTKYVNLESFQRQKDQYSLLDYENAGIYTGSLLDHFMDYKLMWKQLALATYELEALRATIDRGTPDQEIYDLARVKKLPIDQVGAKLRQSSQDTNEDVSAARFAEVTHILTLAGMSEESQALILKDSFGKMIEGLHVTPPSPQVSDYEQIKIFEPNFAGLIKARKLCRVEMAKIVNEVDLVTKTPTIATQLDRDAYFLHPLVFKQLLPVVRAWNDDMLVGGGQVNAPLILGYCPPPARDKTLPSLFLTNIPMSKLHSKVVSSIDFWKRKAKDYRMNGGSGRLGIESFNDGAVFFNDLQYLNPTYRISKISVWQGEIALKGIKIAYANGEETARGDCQGGATKELPLQSDGSEFVFDIQVRCASDASSNTGIIGIRFITSLYKSIETSATSTLPTGWKSDIWVSISRPDLNDRWSLRGLWGFGRDNCITGLGFIWGKDNFVPVPISRLRMPLSRSWFAFSDAARTKVQATAAEFPSYPGQFLMGAFSDASGAVFKNGLDQLRPDWRIKSLEFCKKDDKVLCGLRVNYTNGESITHGSYADKDLAWRCDVNGEIIAFKMSRAKPSTQQDGWAWIQNLEFIIGDAEGHLPDWPLDLSAVRYLGPGDLSKLTVQEVLTEPAPKLDQAHWTLRGFYTWAKEDKSEITGLGCVWGRS